VTYWPAVDEEVAEVAVAVEECAAAAAGCAVAVVAAPFVAVAEHDRLWDAHLPCHVHQCRDRR
jgi:hypothetical protein